MRHPFVRRAYLLCKHGNTTGGLSMFDLLYPDVKFTKLNYNLQRILIECIAHDSELDADQSDLARWNSGPKDKHTIVMKTGPREIKWMEKMQAYAAKSIHNRDVINAPVTLLTTEEYLKLGESANYYRNLIGEGEAS